MYHRQPILAGESDRDQLYKIFSRCGPLNNETFPGWNALPGFPDSQGHPWDQTPQGLSVLETAQKWQYVQLDFMNGMRALTALL
jgi:serine/threonine-protein kinase BUR1